MEVRDHIIPLFVFERWANNEVLRSLQSVDQPPARAVQLLAHIIGAQQLWMQRIDLTGASVRVWPDWTLAECATQLESSMSTWQRYIEQANDDTFQKIITYTNSKGEHWQNQISDIAEHLAMHGTYHRGQIATAMRTAGFTPAYTDYIEAVRRGHVGR